MWKTDFHFFLFISVRSSLHRSCVGNCARSVCVDSIVPAVSVVLSLIRSFFYLPSISIYFSHVFVPIPSHSWFVISVHVRNVCLPPTHSFQMQSKSKKKKKTIIFRSRFNGLWRWLEKFIFDANGWMMQMHCMASMAKSEIKCDCFNCSA